MLHPVKSTILPGGKYGCETCGGRTFRSIDGTYFIHEADVVSPVTKPDPLVEAVIAREIAEEEFFARSYNEFCRMKNLSFGYGNPTRAEVRRWVEEAQNAMIDARVEALLWADAYGLIDLFSPIRDGESVEARTQETMRFAVGGPSLSL